jgi:adenylate kinase
MKRQALANRNDDNQQTLSKRFLTHNRETKQVIDYFRERQMLFDVDGKGSQDEVLSRIELSLKGYL